MKVICIKEGEWAKKLPVQYPVNGGVYTVVDCKMVQGGPCYIFKELPVRYNGFSVAWDVINFAPLDTYKKEELEKELKSIPCLI